MNILKNQELEVIQLLTSNEEIEISGGETTVRQEEDETVIIPFFDKPFFPKRG